MEEGKEVKRERKRERVKERNSYDRHEIITLLANH